MDKKKEANVIHKCPNVFCEYCGQITHDPNIIHLVFRIQHQRVPGIDLLVPFECRNEAEEYKSELLKQDGNFSVCVKSMKIPIKRLMNGGFPDPVIDDVPF